MSDWDQHAKIRRDFRQSKPEDAPCMGKKTAVKKPRPFVVEYNQRPNTPRIDFFMKCDGQWHEYSYSSYYATRTAAERAMGIRKHHFEVRAKHFRVPAKAEWRVRDTREEVDNNGRDVLHLPADLSADAAVR